MISTVQMSQSSHMALRGVEQNNMGTFKSEVDLASSTMGHKYFCSRIGNLKTIFTNQHFYDSK